MIFLREAASFGVPNGLALYRPTGPQAGALEGVPICQRFGHANCAIGYLDQFCEFCPFDFLRPRFPSGESRERAVAKDVDSFGFQIQGWLTEYELHLW